MSRAAKLVAAVLKGLRPLRARFDKFWDVDHRASNFYTDEEWAVVQEKQKAAWNAREKENFWTHVRTEVAPRVKVDLLGDEIIKVAEPRRTPGDLLNKCVSARR